MQALPLSRELSDRIRFWSFLTMVMLVFVHGYNLNERYLQPFSTISEPLTFTTFSEFFVCNGLFRFRIPLLFIITGYLLTIRPFATYGQMAGHRFRKLMVPYLFWSLAGLVITLAFEQFSTSRLWVTEAGLSGPQTKLVTQYDLSDWLTRLVLAPIPFQLWFIRCLFMYNLLSPLLKMGLEHRPWIMLTFFGLAYLVTGHAFLVEGEGLLFFSLGMWLAGSGYDIEKPPQWYSSVTFGLAWVGLLALKTIMAFYLTVEGPVLFFTLSLLHKLAEIVGMIFVWFGLAPMARRTMQWAWFRKLCPYAFIIYALHVPAINYLISPSLRFTSSFLGSMNRLPTFIMLNLAVILVTMLVGLVLKWAAPRFYSLVTGGRG